jgi:3-dehydroquinate dehydratase-2
MASLIYVLNGPNMNLLGKREPEKYGHATLDDVESLCRETARQHGFEVEFRQSNKEGELIDFIHEAAKKKAAGIVINPAGYTTTSIAIMDAILGIDVPTVEVHITNSHARESFGPESYLSEAARGGGCGLGIEGYALAITGLACLVKKK